ncbi:phage tail tape measure protein [Peribacillus frigoritolerans]|uniref:phage tail tape measure protein n=1 Tax=Peribacillus frigoritolerans TaxID=450367 RepID=UPI003D00E646
MADEIGSMIVRVGMDGADFDKGQKNLLGKMNLLKSEMKASQSQFGKYGNSMDALKSKQAILGKQYSLQGQQVLALKKKYEDLAKAHGAESEAALNAGANLNRATAYYNTLGKNLNETSKKIDTMNSKWHKASQGMSTFSNNMSSTGNKMGEFGRTMALSVTAPIAGLATVAVRTGMTFDKEMSKVQAISGATSDELKALRDQAIQLGASTSKSSTEVAAGMKELSAAGFTAKEVMGAIPGVISASEASGADMAQTAEVMASTLNIFSMEAGKASKVADILAKTANISAADITDMQYALKYAGPPAAALGIGLEELSGSIGILTNAGMKGEQAGTTLRGALLALLNPSEENSKMMETMGIAITDAKGNFVGLSKLVENLSESMDGQTETQKAATLASLVGTEAVSGMLSLMSAGPKEIDKMTKSLENSGGASAEAAKIMKDNFAGAMDELLGTLEAIGIQVSDVMTPAIRDVTEWLANMGDKFTALSPEAKKTIIILGLVAAGIAPITLGMAALFKSIGIVSGGLAAGVGWLGKYRSQAVLTTASVTTMGNSAVVASTKMNTANGAMAKSTKGMKGVQGGAIAAGGAMSMFGGKWGMVAGIATTFLPQIIQGGSKLLGFGKNAVTSGGSVAGMGGKVFGAVKNFKNLSTILTIARGGLAAFGGPLGVLAAVGLPLLIQGGVKLYKHLKEEQIPALNDFGNKVSDSTTKAVLSYKKLNDDATVQLNLMSSSGKAVSQDMADNLVATFSKMGGTIKDSLKKDFEDSKKNIESVFSGSVLTDNYQKELLGKMETANQEKLAKVQQYEDRVKEITDRAVEQKRETSKVEKAEIAAINQLMMDMSVKTLSEGQVEQQAIMEKLRINASSITARQAAKTVADSKKAKDGTIKEANEKYDGAIAAIIRERDETGSISKEEADTLIGEAKRQRDESVRKAKEMHKGVVKASKKQAKDHIEDVNWETGEVLTGWDKMVGGIKKFVDWVKDIFGQSKTKDKPSLKKPNKSVAKPPKELAYAKGTLNGSHPGGPAIVSEKGRELINEPGKGTYLSGSKGAEIRNLAPGTSVLPNHHTEKILKRYGMPGYEKGTGDYFDWMLKGPKHLLGKGFEKFDLKDSMIPSWMNNLTGSPIKSMINMGTGWIKGLMDKFSLGGGGGNAPNVSGGASAWRGQIMKAAMAMKESINRSELNGIIAQIQRESGGNQRITQSSAVVDINTLSGNPARGLLQYIPQSFRAYSMPGHNNIYSGYDQLLAFFNNTNWRRDLPYGKRGWGPRGARKYATGGEINHHQLAELGENGWKEWVLTSEPKYRKNNLGMWAEAGRALGVQPPQSDDNNNGSIIAFLAEQVELLREIVNKNTDIYLEKNLIGTVLDDRGTKKLSTKSFNRGIR